MGKTGNTRFKQAIRVGAVTAALVGGTVGFAQPASGSYVANTFVCSTSTGRCYQQNGNFVPGVPCRHAYNVNWRIDPPWKTWSEYNNMCRGWWV